MRRHPIVVLALLLAALGALPASAHSPYFSQSEPILLPDGQPGEMRLLRGDGIIFADPTRIVVLDRDSRLLALSHEGVLMTLICRTGQASCWGYDHATGQVLILDPATFRRDGPIVPGRNQREELWDIEGSGGSWGFAVRGASIAEWLEVAWTLAHEMSRVMALLAATGAAVAATVLLGARRPRNRQAWRLWLWAIGLVLLCVGSAVAIVVAGYVGLLIGLNLTIWAAALGIGAAPILLAWALARWRKPAAAPA